MVANILKLILFDAFVQKKEPINWNDNEKVVNQKRIRISDQAWIVSDLVKKED